MPHPIRQAFRSQGNACVRLGSPLMGRLMAGLADTLAPSTAVGARVLDWPGDPVPDALALRLAGGLHALVLTGQDPALAAAYATGDPVAAATTALTTHEAHLLHWLDSPPQTNEVRRSAALTAAGHALTARFGLPLILSELGASAGLNLWWDHYALVIEGKTYGPPDPVLTLTPDWQGPLAPATTPRIADRAGVDLNPLDPLRDRLRLLAYLWPDQPDRIARTEAAIAHAARHPATVTQGDAATWLTTRLGQRHEGHLHLVFHTIAWQYFPPATQAACTTALAAAGARATAIAPLAHLSMEADATPGTAALTLTLWPGAETREMGRVDFHGRRVIWHP